MDSARFAGWYKYLNWLYLPVSDMDTEFRFVQVSFFCSFDDDF